MSAGATGWLEKKSGGKDGKAKSKVLEKWDRRWFALVGTKLSYYKAEADFIKGRAPLGSLEVSGAQIFLKEVKGTAFRFTVRTSARLSNPPPAGSPAANSAFRIASSSD